MNVSATASFTVAESYGEHPSLRRLSIVIVVRLGVRDDFRSWLIRAA